jgi:hypothetical protein
MHNKFKIYCFVAYTPLTMFRALLCPSSGAPSNCLCSLWLPYDCRFGRASSCGRFIRDKAINFKFIVHLVGCFIEDLCLSLMHIARKTEEITGHICVPNIPGSILGARNQYPEFSHGTFRTNYQIIRHVYKHMMGQMSLDLRSSTCYLYFQVTFVPLCA